MHLKVALCGPVKYLNISETTRGFFNIGFKVVFGVAMLAVTGSLLGDFTLIKLFRGPDFFRPSFGFELIKQFTAAGQETGFHQVGGHGDIATGFVDTL